MEDKKKKSVIEEALIDHEAIMEAADTNAKKKLADEFPERFNNLLKEEMDNKNKSNKESGKNADKIEESKKVDDVESNKESVMKKTKETKKVVNEGEKENKPFEETPKKVPVVKEERDKDFMGDVESDTPNVNTPLPEDGDTFTDKITTNQNTIANDTTLKEEETFDVTGLEEGAVGTALEGASEVDEVVTLEEIEQSITEMEGDQEKPTAGSDNGDAFTELVNMRNKLNEMIGGMEEQKKHGGKQSIPGREKGGPTQQMS